MPLILLYMTALGNFQLIIVFQRNLGQLYFFIWRFSLKNAPHLKTYQMYRFLLFQYFLQQFLLLHPVLNLPSQKQYKDFCDP